MSTRRPYVILLFSVIPLVFAASCAGTRSSVLSESRQFTLDIGKMEDQIDLMQIEGAPFKWKLRLLMRNGFYYVANGASHKIMEFTSYGDLLTLYYNQAENPEPVSLSTSASGSRASNRKAYHYPFREIGEIALGRDGALLVEETVPPERQEFDDTISALLRKIVLRFYPDGSVRDYLGQEGVGGTPFPYIENVSVNERGDITVISRAITSRHIHRFDETGELRAVIRIDEENLPAIDRQAIASLDAVYASPDEDLVFVKVDYYADHKSMVIDQQSSIDFFLSRIYWIDLKTASFAGHVDLPKAFRYTGPAQLVNRRQEEMVQLLLGVAKARTMFLLSPVEDDLYQLLLLNTDGKVLQRTRIVLKDEETMYRTFYVTQDGILTALIGGKLAVNVVLWRTDAFMEGRRDEAR